MTRLLPDQGLPRSAVAALQAAGWDVIHVADVEMSRATDNEIVAFALAEGRTCVTLDADFHTLLATSGMSGPSVVRIRIEGLKGLDLARLLLQIWSRIDSEVIAGAMVTITEDRIRIRRLPLSQ